MIRAFQSGQEIDEENAVFNAVYHKKTCCEQEGRHVIHTRGVGIQEAGREVVGTTTALMLHAKISLVCLIFSLQSGSLVFVPNHIPTSQHLEASCARSCVTSRAFCRNQTQESCSAFKPK